MSKCEEAIELLKEAQGVLSNYWFESGEDDEYNNEDVIAIDQKIQQYLKGVAIQ